MKMKSKKRQRPKNRNQTKMTVGGSSGSGQPMATSPKTAAQKTAHELSDSRSEADTMKFKDLGLKNLNVLESALSESRVKEEESIEKINQSDDKVEASREKNAFDPVAFAQELTEQEVLDQIHSLITPQQRSPSRVCQRSPPAPESNRFERFIVAEEENDDLSSEDMSQDVQSKFEPMTIEECADQYTKETEESDDVKLEGDEGENKNQIKQAVRSAEKSRVSSCNFADAVARAAIQCYEQKMTFKYKKQTCMASILLSVAKDHEFFKNAVDLYDGRVVEGWDGAFIVVSFGAGTKHLPHSVAKNDINNDDSKRSLHRRVRDMHAEVLARRAFQNFLLAQVDLIMHCKRVLEREDPELSAETLGNIVLVPDCPNERHGMKFKLRDGIGVHMYCSAMPCGNACIKRWAKGGKAPFVDCPDWPREEHPAFLPMDRPNGQCAVLLKRDPHMLICPELLQQTHAKMSTRSLNLSNSLSVREDWIPPGTANVLSGQGYLATCSDKIAKWGVLGMQGGWLSVICSRVQLDSITIGHKFSKVHAERALCCRVGAHHEGGCAGNGNCSKSNSSSDLSKSLSKSNSTIGSGETYGRRSGDLTAYDKFLYGTRPSPLFKASSSRKVAKHGAMSESCGSILHGKAKKMKNQPTQCRSMAVLGTSVKFDTGAIGTGDGGGAVFDDHRCCVYSFASPLFDNFQHTDTIDEIFEVLDGRTGFLLQSEQEIAANKKPTSSQISAAVRACSRLIPDSQYLRDKFRVMKDPAGFHNIWPKKYLVDAEVGRRI